MFKKIGNMFLLFSLVLSLLLCTSCGKHEAEGGAVGAGAGAVVGAEVSGKNNKGLGALIGAITGNYFGRKIGRNEDKHEAQAKENNQKIRLGKRQTHKRSDRCGYIHPLS